MRMRYTIVPAEDAGANLNLFRDEGSTIGFIVTFGSEKI